MAAGLAPDDPAGASRCRSRRARLRKFWICFEPPLFLCSSGTASYACLGVRPCLICEPRRKGRVSRRGLAQRGRDGRAA